MRTCLLFHALLAFALAAPAAARRVVAPGAFTGSVPTVIASLTPGFTPSLTPGPPAPSRGSSLAPIPGLVPSAIPAAAPIPADGAVPFALTPRVPVAARSDDAPRSRPTVVRSLADIRRLLENQPIAAGDTLFDGSADAPAPLVSPVDALQVRTMRAETADAAAGYIVSAPSTRHFIKGVRANWSKIGWLDIRVYNDAAGYTFRAVDLSGRPDLVDHLPDVQTHERTLIKKIQMHTNDLQIVLREEGKTPDLIAAGLVTEMKSHDPKSDLAVQLEHANGQLLAHSQRHGLGSGAVAINLVGRKSVPVAQTLKTINDFAAAHPVGFQRVEMYAGTKRKVFTSGPGGVFALEKKTARKTPRQHPSLTGR
jgi:hypothetical protein